MCRDHACIQHERNTLDSKTAFPPHFNTHARLLCICVASSDMQTLVTAPAGFTSSGQGPEPNKTRPPTHDHHCSDHNNQHKFYSAVPCIFIMCIPLLLTPNLPA